MKRLRALGLALSALALTALMGCPGAPGGPEGPSDAEMTAFVFEAANNAGLAEDITGTIAGSLVTATAPVGTDVTALVPTITISEGATVSPADAEAQDFSTGVTYRVTAGDTVSTTDYVVAVIVTEEPPRYPDAAITGFLFEAALNSELPSDITGSIAGAAIGVAVPVGTDRSALVPTIVISTGATIAPASGEAQDFSSPVEYTVTAEDGATSETYTVAVGFSEDGVAPAPGDSGTLTLTATGVASITAEWAKASDDWSAQADLEYRVVLSTSDNIGTVATALSNGTIVRNWTADVTSATALALTAETTYWFNVLVRDEAGNTACYDKDSATTTAPGLGGIKVNRGVDAEPSSYFGYSVALSGDGTTLAVGEYYRVPSSNGCVVVYGWDGDSWNQEAVLTASDLEDIAHLGTSVAISSDGTTIAAGASLHDMSALTNAGEVHVFVKPALGWADATETTRLFPKVALASGNFGHSVAVSDDGSVVAVGGFGGYQNQPGDAYVFVRPGGGWAEHDEGVDYEAGMLTSSGRANFDYFGWAVGISGDGATVAVGASFISTAYVYQMPGGAWVDMPEETAVLTGSVDAHMLGSSVAVSGDGEVIACGAPLADYGISLDVGAVFVYQKPAGDWVDATEDDVIYAYDHGQFSDFGNSLSLTADGGTMLIGSSGDQIDPNDNQGSAYLYAYSGSAWGDAGKYIEVTTGSVSDYFGCSVSISSDGTTLAAGIYSDDETWSASGSAMVFRN